MKSSARTVVFPGAVSFGHTLAPLRRGLGDPCFLAPGDGSIWRTSLLPTGPVTARISRAGTNAVQCVAWGAGAAQFVDMLPAMLGSEDDASDFVPRHPTVAAAQRRVPHLRLGRTGLVLEALIPAIIEQRVPGADAFRSWRVLGAEYGTPAPGPAPEAVRVAPPHRATHTPPPAAALGHDEPPPQGCAPTPAPRAGPSPAPAPGPAPAGRTSTPAPARSGTRPRPAPAAR